MATKKNSKKELLRQRAEKLLPKKLKPIPKVQDKDTKALVHELQVHKIELEMQNEELRKAQAEIEESRTMYSDLYDFAPVGYFTFNPAGEIMDANLTGASLLGVDRSHFLRRPFSVFVDPEFQTLFRDHRLKVLRQGERARCDLKLIKKDETSFYASLDSILVSQGRNHRIRSAVSDITELKKAQEKAETEHAFRIAIENSILSGIAAVDMKGRQSYVNLGFCRMVGRSEAELVGREPPFAYWPPEESDHISKAFQTMIDSKPSHDGFELQFMRKNGERFDALVIPSPLKDHQGKGIGWIATFGDITHLKQMEKELKQLNTQLEERVHQRTAELENANQQLKQEITERKKAEEALRESEQRERERAGELAALLDTVPMPVFISHDPECRHITGNRAADELLRNPRGGEASLGAPIDTRPHHFQALKDGRELAVEELPAQRAARGERVEGMEFSLAFDDGTVREVISYGIPLQNADGQPHGSILAFADITERKRMEESLRQSEEKFRIFAESTRDIESWINPEGKFVFVSPSSKMITGRDSREFMEDRNLWRNIIHPEDRPIFDRHIKAREHVPQEIQFRIIHADGSIRWIGHVCQQIFDKEGHFLGIRSSNRDITERNRMEEELRKSYDELERRVQERTTELAKVNENLRAEIAERKRAEEVLQKMTHNLNERVKEANCLYSISYYIDKRYLLLEGKLKNIVNLIPSGWQYPEVMCSRIVIEDREYKTENFRETPWKQSSDIIVDGKKIGTIEVFYLEKKPEEYEGPFLKEERGLIDAIAIELGEMLAHMKADQALAEQSRVLEAFFTSTITPLVFLDRDFNFIRVNEAYARACQRDISEFPGHNHFEFFPHEENEAIFRRVVETKIPYQAFEKPFSFLDHPEWGVTYWDWTLTPLLGDSGEVEFLVFSLENVTERKQAEEALRIAHLYNRNLIEVSLDPLVTISAEGKVMDVNRATEIITGVSPQELIGSDFSDYFTDPAKAKEGYQQVFTEGSVRNYPLAIRHTSGHVTDVLYNATVYRNEAGEAQGVFAAARDITEYKRAEEALRESENRLRSLSSQLLTVQENERRRISREIHDSLGQSLSAIKFKIENITHQMRESSYKEMLETLLPIIQESIEESRRIQMDLRPSILDDLGIIATLTWFSREFQKIYSNIRVDKEVEIAENEVPDTLKTVIYRISQEALNNIAKHSQADSVRLSLKKAADRIELAIRDNGRGFDLEGTLSADTSRKGLGLTSMRERTELSGGRFEIESTPGKGTIIKAYWPT